jgi:hypothetical protein
MMRKVVFMPQNDMVAGGQLGLNLQTG